MILKDNSTFSVILNNNLNMLFVLKQYKNYLPIFVNNSFLRV